MKQNYVLISNPQSGHNRRNGRAVPDLAAHFGVPVFEARTMEEIESCLPGIAAHEPDLLIVSGGDGMVDAVLTAIRQSGLFGKEPVFALLPGGSTNMIHRDIGYRRPPLPTLEILLRFKDSEIPEKYLRKRHPFQLHTGDGFPPRLGFFWTIGALPRVMQSVQTGYQRGGVTGRPKEYLALLGAVRRFLFGDVRKDALVYPTTIAWECGKNKSHKQEYIFVIVTTLEQLICNMRIPRDKHPMNLYAFKYPYERLHIVRWLLTRYPLPQIPNRGGELFNGNSFQFQFSGLWSLDGELFGSEGKEYQCELKLAPPATFFVV